MNNKNTKKERIIKIQKNKNCYQFAQDLNVQKYIQIYGSEVYFLV